MPAKVYTDKDANLSVLRNKTLAVLGFGSQGHAHALNLKDSGLNVIIGLYETSKSIPDTKQPVVYQRDIAPNLSKGKTLLFSHGFSIHFKTIIPPKFVDVILVAP